MSNVYLLHVHFVLAAHWDLSSKELCRGTLLARCLELFECVSSLSRYIFFTLRSIYSSCFTSTVCLLYQGMCITPLRKTYCTTTEWCQWTRYPNTLRSVSIMILLETPSFCYDHFVFLSLTYWALVGVVIILNSRHRLE